MYKNNISLRFSRSTWWYIKNSKILTIILLLIISWLRVSCGVRPSHGRRLVCVHDLIQVTLSMRSPWRTYDVLVSIWKSFSVVTCESSEIISRCKKADWFSNQIKHHWIRIIVSESKKIHTYVKIHMIIIITITVY